MQVRRTQAYVLGLALAAFTAVQAGAQTTGTMTDSSRMNGTGTATASPTTANGYGTHITATPPCKPYRTGTQVGGTTSTVNTNPGGGTTVVNNHGDPSAMNPCRDSTGTANGSATANGYGTNMTMTPPCTPTQATGTQTALTTDPGNVHTTIGTNTVAAPNDTTGNQNNNSRPCNGYGNATPSARNAVNGGTNSLTTPATTTSTSAGDVTTGSSSSGSMGTSGSMSGMGSSSASTSRHTRHSTGLRVRKDGNP